MGDILVEEDSLVEEGIRVEADKVGEDSRRVVVGDSLGEDSPVEGGILVVEDSLVEEDNLVEEGIRVAEADILVVGDNLEEGSLVEEGSPVEEGIQVVAVVATS